MSNKIDVIIPTLNEATYIKACLQSVMSFEQPPGTSVAVYVIDGGSSDKTRELVLKAAAESPQIHLLDNPGRIQSCALNKGLRCGDGDYMLRLDAHAFYPRDYLARCWSTFKTVRADNVGGVFVTQPGTDRFQAKLIQAATTHWFGVGNSGFRLTSGPGPADTVPYGFFKKSIFNKIGYFDERLVRAQDYEFNRRIIVSGGTVWRDPEIKVFYYNMPTLLSFYRKQLLEGCYNSYLWYLAPYAFAPRHCATGIFVAGLLLGCLGSAITRFVAWPFIAAMLLYFVLALAGSVQQARRYRMPSLALLLPFCFMGFHVFHGLGVLWGILRLCARSAPVQHTDGPWPEAGRFRAWPII